MISVDTVFCTLRVKADRFALCHGNSHSAVSLLHAHFRENRKRLDTLVCKHPYHTLRVKTDRFALCHGNSHSATTLLHAHFRENRTLRVKRDAPCYALSLPYTEIRNPWLCHFFLISVDIIKDRTINCAST